VGVCVNLFICVFICIFTYLNRADVVHTNPANVRKVVTEKILGHVVLTRYNNRTYTVDDIMWDKTPLSTFTSSSGQEMTFAEYYK